MKMKRYKRKKLICRIIKKILFAVGACGVLAIITACDGITEDTLSLIGGVKQIGGGYIVIIAAYALHSITDYIEHDVLTKK